MTSRSNQGVLGWVVVLLLGAAVLALAVGAGLWAGDRNRDADRSVGQAPAPFWNFREARNENTIVMPTAQPMAYQRSAPGFVPL
jgi:hypothetical protein